MGRLTKIDKMPAEIRELIASLRQQGREIDEILAKLRELDVDVSRSALGRHIKEIDQIGEEIRKSRAIAEAIVERFGDAPESKTARLNIELMHSQVLKLLGSQDGDGNPVVLGPREVQFLSDALYRLSKAAKDDAEREIKIREKALKEIRERASKKLDEIQADPQLSPKDVLKRIREEIYGLVDPTNA